MKLIDYTGKLNIHEKYLEIIDKLENKTEYIEIVILDEKDKNELVNQFSKDIILKTKVSKWWGTETTAINNLYKIKSSKELFKSLRQYETFCKYHEYGTDNKSLKFEDYSELTNFGADDIAFYSKNDECLLFTTTHEGFITINEELVI